MPEARQVIIAHTLDHALDAFAAADALDTPLVLQSAPDAIFYAGSLYLLHMFIQAWQSYPEVKACFILDCGEAGAEAISALQGGHRCLRSSAPPELYATLEDIAGQMEAELVGGPYEALDLLQVRDTKGACMNWLRERTL